MLQAIGPCYFELNPSFPASATDKTLRSNAGRFYSSMEKPAGVKGLSPSLERKEDCGLCVVYRGSERAMSFGRKNGDVDTWIDN